MGIDPITAGFFALSAAAKVSSDRQQKKAASAQREGQERIFQQEKKKAEVENVRKIRQQIRDQRIAQGSLASQAALTGGVGGSAVAGASASAASQTAGNVSFMQDISEANTNINQIQLDTANRVSNANSKAATYGAIGEVAGTIFGDLGGFKKIASG